MPKGQYERLKGRREKLEAELQAIREKEQEEIEKRDAIAGRVALAYAQENPSFHAELMDALERRLTKTKERLLFGLRVSARRKAPKTPASSEETGTAPDEEQSGTSKST
jgi:hypothetical protein